MGLNIRVALIFSLPKPLGPTVTLICSPGTISVYRHSRRIVAGIAAAHRILYNGFPEISLVITAADALVYRLPKIAVYDMYVLHRSPEYTGHTCILADGHVSSPAI